MTIDLTQIIRETLSSALASVECQLGIDDVYAIADGLVDTLEERKADLLVEWVRDAQASVCAYCTRDGDARTCDCKYSMIGRPSGEATGCPELRAAARVLSRLRGLPPMTGQSALWTTAYQAIMAGQADLTPLP